MLSICIPIYNFNCVPTIELLHNQASKAGIPFEIVLMDDASERTFRTINSAIAGENIYYHQLKQNIGRSAIRNRLVSKAKFPYLLFLDCDVLIQKQDFVATYIDLIQKENPEVVCGGRLYPATIKDNTRKLRWNYGVQSESKSAGVRSKNPHQSFMTNNFVIKKEILTQIPFNEELSGYGHEDTLLGFELQQKGFQILHIENPVMNGDIETNEVFLLKTEEGLLNLIRIYKALNNPDFSRSVKLLATYQSLKEKKMDGALRLQHIMTRSTMRSNLIKGKAGIRSLNIYKLGYFIQHLNKI